MYQPCSEKLMWHYFHIIIMILLLSFYSQVLDFFLVQVTAIC